MAINLTKIKDTAVLGELAAGDHLLVESGGMAKRIPASALKQPGMVFDTVADMEAYITSHAEKLTAGMDLFIREEDAPDYWWDGEKAVEVETDLSVVKADIAGLKTGVETNSKAIAANGVEIGKISDEIAEQKTALEGKQPTGDYALRSDVTAETTARQEAVTAEKNRAVARENEIEALFSMPTQEAVATWLSEHPEATTTVQDASLEVSKFTDDAKKYIVKDYVTPEMFGAVGDGVTDDTEAIQAAVATKKTVVLHNKYVCAGFEINTSQKILNFGTLTLNGTITVNSYAKFVGGSITAKNCYAFTFDASSESIRRVTINDVFIYGSLTNETSGAFNFIGNGDSTYNTFCDIKNIKIYGCYHGLNGAVRASKFDVIIEQSHYPIVFEGDFNIIMLQGQTIESDINKTVVYIDGNYNNIIGGFYDVGGKYQDVFVEFSPNARENVCNTNFARVNGYRDCNSNSSWGDEYENKLFLLENPPISSVELNNIKDFNTEKLFKRNPSWLEIARIDENTEGYIDINIDANVLYFLTVFKAFFISSTYAFDKIEVYVDQQLISTVHKWNTMTFKHKNFASWYDTRNKSYCFRCYVQNPVRLRGMCLYS